jgi:DNA-binding transcriptional regulator YiaG
MTTRQTLELVEMRLFVRSGEARDRRRRSGLSLAEVGRTVGASTAAISRWETGQRRPTGAPALAYARLLKQLGGGDGSHIG